MKRYISMSGARFGGIGLAVVGLLGWAAAAYGAAVQPLGAGAERETTETGQPPVRGEGLSACGGGGPASGRATLVPNAPLAEDAGLGTCTDDDDCTNLAVCRDSVCYVPKNRYISFQPNNGDPVAFRIDLTVCGPFPTCTFEKKWVGEPDPETGIARVEEVSLYREWGETVVHVGDLEIVPDSTYSVQAIAYGSDENDPLSYSAALILPTVPKPVSCELVTSCLWADMVGDFVVPGVYQPPDGILDYNDIVAMIKGILELSGAPPITWTDLMREVPNGRLDIRDLVAVDDAYRKEADPYPGSSPCSPGLAEAGRAKDTSAQDGTRAPEYPTPLLECRMFDDQGNLLAQSEEGVSLAVPGQTVTGELFFSDVQGLRAYQVRAMIQAHGHPVDIVTCPGGVAIETLHHVCAGTRENCIADSECKWCVGGTNNGKACVHNSDCPDGGTCADGPKVCVGGANHRLPCTGAGDCPGVGAQCVACVADFAFYNSDSRNLVPVCPRLEVGATGEPTDLGSAPPGYLGSYYLKVPVDAGGITFKCLVVRLDDANEELSFFLTRDQTANDPSIPYLVIPDPCSVEILHDCNANGVPDECDIGDEAKCATLLCQAYISQGGCGQSANCNGNEFPDECEVAPETCPPEPGVSFYCCPDCVGCPPGCICGATGDPCPNECDCTTGDGCPEGCEPECVVACEPDCNGNLKPDACDIAADDGGYCTVPPCSLDCQPEGQRGHGIPDECDIVVDDGGLCLGEGCSWDCQVEGEAGHGVPDECDADCSNDGCPDNCEALMGRPIEQACGDGVAQQDCDHDGRCNIDEIAAADGGTCTGDDCSSDCHFHGEPGPERDAGLGIPDECDIADCPGDVACGDCDANRVPDWCDIHVGCADACCTDCQPEGAPGHGVPDRCDINPSDPDGNGFVSADCQYNGRPDECDLDPAWGGDSCDVNANDVPDECDVLDRTLGMQCGACEPYPDCATCRSFGPPGINDVAMGAAFTIRWLDGTPDTVIEVRSGGTGASSVFDRGAPHLNGDDDDSPLLGDPCLMPRAFPTNERAGHEVHTEIMALNLVNEVTGAWVEVSPGVEPTLGEAQGTCLDFPADSFFNLYLELNTGSETLYNDTPISVRGVLPDFDWSYAVYASDHGAPGIPLLAPNGVQKGYLVRAQLGFDVFAPATESCETTPGIAGSARVSFAIDGATEGLLMEPGGANRVKEDKDANVARRMVTVYRTLGDAPGGWAGPWNNTNDWVPNLIGSMGAGGFVDGDAINSLSYGRDGTGGAGDPLLYFSVGGSSIGLGCTDVNREAPIGGADRHRPAADIYIAPGMAFGAYDAPFLSPPCDAGRRNCLVIDQTAAGLGPLLVDLPGQEGRGLTDNIIALEISEFPDDRAYFTFKANVGPLVGKEATIYVYHYTGGSFGYSALAPYRNLAQVGIGPLQANDVIDALAVSDVSPGQQQPDGVWNESDEVLFSLAPGSPSLTALAPGLCRPAPSCSAADIFRYTHAGVLTRFLSAAQLGLNAADNVDAIDVGAATRIDDANDCNRNGIVDACDMARGFSTDANVNDVPDDCEPACLFRASRPNPGTCCPEGFPPRGGAVRYLALRPTDPGRRQAIRVTITDAPPAFASYIGQSLWVGEPTEVCENAGQGPNVPVGQCGGAPGLPRTVLVAGLGCHDLTDLDDQPLFTDWHGKCTCGVCLGGLKPGETCDTDDDCLGPPIHVFHSAVVPSAGAASDPNSFIAAVYDIEVIDAVCPWTSPNAYSDPLEITMSKWGDVARNCPTPPCPPPDGRVDVSLDVTFVLDKFKNLPGALLKVRSDLRPATPDRVIDILDVTLCLDAFRGMPYPYTAVPGGPCP